MLFIYFEMAQREDEEVCGVTELLVSGQFCMLLYSWDQSPEGAMDSQVSFICPSTSMIKNVLNKVRVYSFDYRISSDHLIGSHEFKLQWSFTFQVSTPFLWMCHSMMIKVSQITQNPPEQYLNTLWFIHLKKNLERTWFGMGDKSYAWWVWTIDINDSYFILEFP